MEIIQELFIRKIILKLIWVDVSFLTQQEDCAMFYYKKKTYYSTLVFGNIII